MPEVIEALITGVVGAAIAAGAMGIVQYKIKRKDTKEDAEDEQTKDIRDLKQAVKDLHAEVSDLRKYHENDMAVAKEREADEMQMIKDELCILSYAMLAALSGLKQQGCNGEVTVAYSKLEKHLNQQAHGQR